MSQVEQAGGASNDVWQQMRAIFDEAISMRPAERTAFIRQKCGSDSDLLHEVQSLLDASDSEEIAARDLAANGSKSRDGFRAVGPYQLDRLIGRGGMGAVYLAHRADGEFHQKVAIKLIDLPLATNLYRDQFRMERQILAALNHPNIARLLDGGVTDHGELYLVMEYIDGVSILRYCMDDNLPLRSRLFLFQKVCSAVQYAHQNLVIHRDLKPDNILVTPDGTPRLVDFGTAKLLSPLPEDRGGEFTRHGIRPFTPQYASPEQILGKPMSTASDTYSLGVLLFQLIADVPPYELKEFSTEEMLRVICSKQPPKPGTVALSAELPDEDLDSIVLMALRKEPEERYLTVAQLDADIQAWLEGRPVMARRGTWRYRASKFVGRNKVALGVMCLLSATVLCGAAGIVWQARVANRERANAEITAREMQGLSYSFLSEIDVAVRELPGSTPVRQLMVKRVLEHLDQLATNTNGDRTTQFYLADAYRRLGGLQGNPLQQNIGDALGGLDSLNKALAIVQRLRATDPNDPATMELSGQIMKMRGLVYWGDAKPQQAAADLVIASHDLSEVANRRSATVDEIANVGEAYHNLGDLLGEPTADNLGDYSGALANYKQARDYYQRALALDSSYARGRREVAMYPMKVGSILILTDPAAAAGKARESLSLWSDVPAEDKSDANTQRTIRYATLMIAQSSVLLRDYKSAFSICEELTPQLAQKVAADPRDAQAKEDYAYVLQIEAHAYIDMLNPLLYPRAELEKQGNTQHALKAQGQLVAELEKLAMVDPGNMRWTAWLARERVFLGALQHSVNPNGNAKQLEFVSISALRQMVSSAPQDTENLDYLASAMVAVKPLRDSRLAVQYAEQLVILTHRANPNQLLTLAQAYRVDGQAAEAAATAREGLGLLPDIRPVTRPIRCQVLLQDILNHQKQP